MNNYGMLKWDMRDKWIKQCNNALPMDLTGARKLTTLYQEASPSKRTTATDPKHPGITLIEAKKQGL